MMTKLYSEVAIVFIEIAYMHFQARASSYLF